MNLNGTHLGQYQIIEQIGQGGMGQVYKAYQPNLDRYVAIKVLTGQVGHAPDFLTRFEREAKTIAKLRHRNILTIFDYGHEADMFYLVMEYVQHGTLRERLGWPQDLGYTVNLISQLGDALAHAHREGVVHRDVKPANILVAEEDWFLLSDFGLVKMIEDSHHLTASGASLGTPHYMSPEQAQGLAVDRRSDIYSLGLVLYEAVTGQMPFDVDSPVVVLMKHISEPIAPPRALRSDLPEAMEQVILKALAKAPEARYQQMEQFIAALQAAQAPSARQGVAMAIASPDNFETRLPQGRDTLSIASPLTPPPPAETRYSPAPTLSKRAIPWLEMAIGIILMVGLVLGFGIFHEALTAQAITPPATTEADPAGEFTVPAATPRPTIEMRVWATDRAEMVFVPAGPFMMGSEALGDDERPVHQVYLDAFWLDRYEVTNERFARFVAETGHQTQAEQIGWGWVWREGNWQEVAGANWQNPAGPDSTLTHKANHPVVLVSWADAQAYCGWAGKRLPTEAEWEKAARGDRADPAALYAWGAAFDLSKTNTKEANRGDTTPVGSFSPGGDSPYGAADMTGNVWEWVSDWYAANTYRQQAGSTNPTGPAEGSDKVLRGGSWLFEELYARSAFRYNLRPDYTYDFSGFRCSSDE